MEDKNYGRAEGNWAEIKRASLGAGAAHQDGLPMRLSHSSQNVRTGTTGGGLRIISVAGSNLALSIDIGGILG